MNGPARWLWVRCLMDQQLHLLDRQRVLDLAAVGCALARCGILLLIPEVALYPVGEPCPACLGGLLSSTVDETEHAGNDGAPPRRGADQRGAESRAGQGATPMMCRSGQVAVGDAHPLVGDEGMSIDPVLPVAARFRDHPRGTPLVRHREPESAALRWGCCPADRLLHLLNPRAVCEATAVGWAKAHCGRLIFAANLTRRGDSVGMCVSCVAAGSAP